MIRPGYDFIMRDAVTFSSVMSFWAVGGQCVVQTCKSSLRCLFLRELERWTFCLGLGGREEEKRSRCSDLT